MASVAISRTTALYPNAVFVQWDVVSDETGAFTVDIFRSGSPQGPWDRVADSLTDAYQFLDDKFNLPPASPLSDVNEGFNQFSLSRSLWYMVTVTPPSGPANAFSSVAEVEPGLDRRTRLFKRKILRDESVAFRNLNGIALVVIKRRRWGTRCDNCWDPQTNEATLEHCPQCFGTSFKGGYWAPVAIRGRRSPGPVQTQMTGHGDQDRREVRFIILDYPMLEKKDIIVDLRRNERFIVEMVTPTELKTVTVHQTINASELSRNSVEYSIPIDPIAMPSLY